jgi:hypothetical protein
VEDAERYADGGLSLEELQSVQQKITREWCTYLSSLNSAIWLCVHPVRLQHDFIGVIIDAGMTRSRICDVFRDVMGAGALNVSPQAVDLAHAAYNERENDGSLDSLRLAMLADALEEYDNVPEPVLTHLRGPEPHFRGCWVLDQILGRK